MAYALILGRLTWNGDGSLIERTVHSTFEDAIAKIRRDHPEWLRTTTDAELRGIKHDLNYGIASSICGNGHMSYSISRAHSRR